MNARGQRAVRQFARQDGRPQRRERPAVPRPRTPSTVLLLKEFLPLEYHQQLSAGVQHGGTLAFFFSGSPEKVKQCTTNQPLTVRGVALKMKVVETARSFDFYFFLYNAYHTL